MRCVATAREIATKAHKGQKRENGEDYIIHPRAVASLVESRGANYECVAWLHDVIEDTVVTVDFIIRNEFDLDIISSLVAITKIEGEPYSSYLLRVASDNTARMVKIADLTHNLSDHSRNARRDKYEAAKMFLEMSEMYFKK